MKELLVGLALVTLLPALPACAEDSGPAFGGLSLSLGAGYQYDNIFQENVRTTNGAFSFKQPDATRRSMIGQVQLGYGFNLGEKFNLSVNAFHNVGGGQFADIKATNFQDQVGQSLRNSTGFYLAPGYYINDKTLVFIKAGVVGTRQTYTRDSEEVALDNTIRGRLLGLGAKYMLSSRVFVSADMTRYTYGSRSWDTRLVTIPVIMSSKARQLDGVLSVGYQF
jgi:opacity protein-like surface antigen